VDFFFNLLRCIPSGWNFLSFTELLFRLAIIAF
jgi:hypothetical protein